jgi:Tol biopolymer transport system component
MKNFTGTIVLFIFLNAVLFFVCGQSEAQLAPRFGKNKVHYKDFKWATLKTSHFTIYFYQGQEQLARNTEKMVERAYQYLSETLNHQFSQKIPLIIYASSDDFQQTEIISGFVGEGIGGVTESLKGRIVIPFLGSYRNFNHVLVHELVHAFQFDILSEGGAPIGVFSSSLYIPLWFIEGMAEYLSEYTNPLTDMWLHDAVYNDTLPSAKKIEGIQDIRAYRFGESLVGYICDKHSVHILGDLLREIAKTESWGKAIQKTANTPWKTIYEDWLNMVKKTYAADKPGLLPIQDQAKLLISHKKDEFYLNIIPAVSPDGKYVAFISDRDFYRTIYLASAETGNNITTLVEGERRGTYETLRFLNTSIAWSPDSRQIAFTAKAGGENAIYVLDIHSKKVIKKLTPDVTSLSFLAWSPDAQHIVFTGIKNGQEDLYLIAIENQELIQLTQDLYSNRHPAWSPDGTKIAFTTDAGNFSDLEELEFGPSNLAIYDLEAHTTRLLTNNAVNDFTPVWSPDGSMLAFISDLSGLCNIYLLDLRGHDLAKYSSENNRIIRLTNVNTGIVGLTEDNPALTWAKETGKLVFSGFSNTGWDIFSLNDPAVQYQEYLAEVGGDETLIIAQQDKSSDETVGRKDWGHSLPEKESPEIKDYKARLSPEYIFGGGGGNEKDFIIFARMGFSDMLSNHRLTIGCNLTSVFDESAYLVAYTNRAHRLSYEIYAFQVGGDLGTYSLEDAELELEVERGAGLTFLWPFDKFRRMELGLEGRMVKGELLTEAEETEEIDDQFFITPTLAYVHDTTLYTVIGQLDGRRYRYSFNPAIGNFTYLTLAADHRWYWRLTKRSTMAFRAMTVGSFGENARIFEIGGPTTFRGKTYDDDDDVRGTKFALGNIEYRFPLLPKFNILRGNIFWDMVLAWTDNVQPFTTQDVDFIRLKDLQAAYGAGIRIPLRSPFGIINLRFDIAQATDLTQKIGDVRYLFSIGNDF